MHTIAGNSSATDTPCDCANRGITKAPNPTPSGCAVCRMPITSPRRSGGNQPTTTRALAEQLAADGLLLFQAANCNHQIPAKLYEYLRAGRPILALTDAAGNTAATLRGAPLNHTGVMRAAAELARGRKESHWMWFVFPQIAGLGSSDNDFAVYEKCLQDIQQMIDQLLLSVGAWLVPDRTGVWQVGRLTAPAGSPAATFTADHILSQTKRPPADPDNAAPS